MSDLQLIEILAYLAVAAVIFVLLFTLAAAYFIYREP